MDVTEQRAGTVSRLLLKRSVLLGDLVDVQVGDPDFTMHLDSSKVSKQVIVTALKAGGDVGAKIKS
ncbi:MAG: hypothetical protein ACI9S9_001968 [Planctomycetota bacterium]|jgi:hypothetical protein